MHFTSTLYCGLVAVLAIALSASVEAATSRCQMCVNDVASTIPKCKGVDNQPTPEKISDLSSSAQACMCAIAYDASPFKKCDPLCPPGNMDKVASDAAAFGTVYCKPDGSGPLSSLSSSAASSRSSSESSHLISAAAAAIVLSAAAML
ncbi:unnamed protein product [Mortierella alpina]